MTIFVHNHPLTPMNSSLVMPLTGVYIHVYCSTAFHSFPPPLAFCFWFSSPAFLKFKLHLDGLLLFPTISFIFSCLSSIFLLSLSIFPYFNPFSPSSSSLPWIIGSFEISPPRRLILEQYMPLPLTSLYVKFRASGSKIEQDMSILVHEPPLMPLNHHIFYCYVYVKCRLET